MSSSELALFEKADAIIATLPSEMQNDPVVSDFVIEALENKISTIEIRTTALEIGQEQLKQAMTHGFNLVNQELQTVKQEAREDRIHATYAKQEAERARAIAEQSWAKLQEVAVGVAKAEAKADGARDIAKTTSRFAGIDPWVPVALTAIVIFVALTMFTRVEKQERRPERESQSSVAPTPTPAPLPANTYDCAGSKFNGSTVDFSRCRKLSGV